MDARSVVSTLSQIVLFEQFTLKSPTLDATAQMARRKQRPTGPKGVLGVATSRTRQLLLSEAWGFGGEVMVRQGGVRSELDDATIHYPEQMYWPSSVEYVAESVKPYKITFERVEPPESCECESPCRFRTCSTAAGYSYCSSSSCRHGNNCGNTLAGFPKLQLRAQETSFGFGVYAEEHIDGGVIIGEYVGDMTIGRPAENDGYLLRMKARATEAPRDRVYIDASRRGNITRFINHSCKSNTTFEEVCREDQHSVVVVTRQEIRAGEELTVDYGDELWFVCSCGQPECQDRDDLDGSAD